VEREELGLILRVRTGLSLDRSADLAVELPAATEREALVRDVAGEPVTEPVSTADVGVDQPREPSKGRLVTIEPRRHEELRRELDGEAHPEHGEIPQSRAIGSW